MSDKHGSETQQLKRTDVAVILDREGIPTFKLPNGEQLSIRPRVYVDGELVPVTAGSDSPYGDIGVWELRPKDGDKNIRIELTPEFEGGDS